MKRHSYHESMLLYHIWMRFHCNEQSDRIAFVTFYCTNVHSLLGKFDFFSFSLCVLWSFSFSFCFPICRHLSIYIRCVCLCIFYIEWEAQGHFLGSASVSCSCCYYYHSNAFLCFFFLVDWIGETGKKKEKNDQCFKPNEIKQQQQSI